MDVALPIGRQTTALWLVAWAIGRQTTAIWLVALPIGRQTTALWLVFPEDIEEAVEMLAPLEVSHQK